MSAHEEGRSGLRWAIVAVIAISIAVYFQNYLFYENLHPVIEDHVYRSAQPTAKGLQRAIESAGLRSVINLKSGDPGDVPAHEISDIAQSAKLDLRYVRLSARRWPSPQEVQQLIENLDTAPRPVLIHCQGGTDRSGLASAVALLLADRDLAEADAQFAIRFGYPGPSLGSDLPGFLAEYREWLAEHRHPHTADRFRSWVATDYVAYYYEAEIDFDVPEEPIRVGDEFTLRLRVTNRSSQDIPLRCDEGAGVRLSVRLRALAPEPRNLRERRFCSSDTALAPGAEIEISTDTYRMTAPGKYEFTADLVDEQREHWFADMGSAVAKRTLVVR